MAARWCLAEVPLAEILARPLIAYEADDVTRLILDTPRRARPSRRSPISRSAISASCCCPTPPRRSPGAASPPGITPEIAAAVSQDHAQPGPDPGGAQGPGGHALPQHDRPARPLAVRLQPNHPTDDPRGITASILDGLLLGCGDAVIGINPASDNSPTLGELLQLLDDVIRRFEIPTQGCVLTHVTTTLEADRTGARRSTCVFQSIAGTAGGQCAASASTLAMLEEAHEAALALKRGTRRRQRACISRPARARPSRPMPITASTSRPWRPAPTRVARGLQAAAGQHRRRLHRARIPLRRQADHPRRAGRPFLRQAAWACRWASTSATPTTPRPTRTTWTRC